jgi:L-amino acid N-acyltransferase YncA
VSDGPVVAVRPMTAADWPAVAEIYRQGIEDGEATFESDVPSWSSFDAGRLAAPRLVAVRADEPSDAASAGAPGTRAGSVVGWAACSPVSSRSVYRGVVEHSVYIHRDARDRGVGRALLEAFVAAAEDAGLWTIQSSVFPENAASLRLHASAGFRVVGRRERIARSTVGPHAGLWRDTVLIERRSIRNGLG